MTYPDSGLALDFIWRPDGPFIPVKVIESPRIVANIEAVVPEPALKIKKVGFNSQIQTKFFDVISSESGKDFKSCSDPHLGTILKDPSGKNFLILNLSKKRKNCYLKTLIIVFSKTLSNRKNTLRRVLL